MGKLNNRGNAQVKVMIGVVVLLVLVSALAPTALVGLFNTTAYQCPGGHINATGCFVGGVETALSGIPSWVIVALGSLGAIAVVFLIYKASNA